MTSKSQMLSKLSLFLQYFKASGTVTNFGKNNLSMEIDSGLFGDRPVYCIDLIEDTTGNWSGMLHLSGDSRVGLDDYFRIHTQESRTRYASGDF